MLVVNAWHLERANEFSNTQPSLVAPGLCIQEPPLPPSFAWHLYAFVQQAQPAHNNMQAIRKADGRPASGLNPGHTIAARDTLAGLNSLENPYVPAQPR